MDIDILIAIQNFRESIGPALNGIIEALRMLGEPIALMALASLVLWGIDKRAGFYVAFNCAWGLLINQFLKITACVYRPWIRDARVVPAESALKSATSYSFPSTHTTFAVAMWGGVGVSLGRKRKWVLWLGVAMSLIIGLSRMYVGVHTPQDVLVSAAIGAILLWAVLRLLDWLDKNPAADIYVLLAGMACVVALGLYATYKPYPMDYAPSGDLLVDPKKMIVDTYRTVGLASGFFIGWFIERRFIKYSVDGNIITRAIRVAVGFAALLGLQSVLSKAFAVFGYETAQIASNAFVMLYTTAIYPFIFTKVEALIFKRLSAKG